MLGTEREDATPGPINQMHTMHQTDRPNAPVRACRGERTTTIDNLLLFNDLERGWGPEPRPYNRGPLRKPQEGRKIFSLTRNLASEPSFRPQPTRRPVRALCQTHFEPRRVSEFSWLRAPIRGTKESPVVRTNFNDKDGVIRDGSRASVARHQEKLDPTIAHRRQNPEARAFPFSQPLCVYARPL
jgi:hypothetical protein